VFWYYRLLGHDVAITPSAPVLVETNGDPDVASEELNEPILLNERNREEFKRYDLLANRLLD
jgi:hypothetical protein